MNKLLIVESYTKTNTIKKYLNDPTFIVTHSSGHVYNLPKDKIGFDTNTWDLEYIKTNPKIISNIRDFVSKSDIIYIATDPDLEGETIAYNIKDSIRDLIKKINNVIEYLLMKLQKMLLNMLLIIQKILI